MRIRTPRSGVFVLAFCAVLTGPIASIPVRAQVVDGGFEQGPRRWKTADPAPSGGEVPICAVDLNLPVPPGASEGRRFLAVLGDVSGAPLPGKTPSFIFQDFLCDTDRASGGYCTVTFDAALWLAPGDKAAVLLKTSQHTTGWSIPGSPRGKRGRYTVSVSGCTTSGSNSRVVFAVWSASSSNAGTRSVLWIDNVDSYCTAADKSSTGLIRFSNSSIPFDPDSLTGRDLRVGQGGADCNLNLTPDQFELSQGFAEDQDRDGVLDICTEQKQGVNWILLCMGVLILGVTVLRLIRKNRKRIG